MAIRKSVRNLFPYELAKLRYGFSLMMNIKDQRGYMFLAGIHNITQNKCKHGETETASDPNFRLFLPWHRAYLYWFEKYLQDSLHDTAITVPWWDWTSNDSRNEGIPRAFADDTVNGLSNPLYTFHVELPEWVNLEPFKSQTGCPKSRSYYTHREPGNSFQLPSREDIKYLLSLTDYGDFSDGLEDIHNRIHGWVGGRCGDMSYVTFAAFDPIFWSHHCMIDRIFWLWQLSASHSLPLFLYDQVLDPFNLTVRQVLNIYQLGYDYAGQQALVGM